VLSVPGNLLKKQLGVVCKELGSELELSPEEAVPPSESSFYEWRRSWINSGYEPQSLVDRFDLRGRRPSKPPASLDPILKQVIENFYASGNRPSVTAVLEEAIAQVDLHNVERSRQGNQELIPRPTRRVLERSIGEYDRFFLLQRRYGTATARQATMVYRKTPRPRRIGERVEVDHTPLDLLVVDADSGMFLGRPHLTALIDVATRMVLGLWISFRKPSSAVLLRALKHAILPKHGVLHELGIKEAWLAQGVPSILYVDNGKEFYSAAFINALKDLGISVVYCPPRQPRFKGVVERWLKEVNYNFAHLLPGSTFAKYYERGEYDSVKNSVLTLTEAKRLIYRWVLEVYHKKFHHELQTCPLEKWHELASLGTPALPRNLDALDVYLSPLEKRTLSSKGIAYSRQQYVSPELSDIRRRLGNVNIEIRPNLDNIGHIYVLHPETNKYFVAMSTDLEYADGLSIEQDTTIRRVAREKYAALPHHDAALAAKHEILEEARDAIRAREDAAPAAGKKPAEKGRPVKPKVSKAKRPKSDIATQSRMDTAATARAEANAKRATEVREDLEISFDDVEAFVTGQEPLL
jgi:putative transposase